jgi:glycosyltransferase involved in cell wall biosynthesis
MNNRPLVSIVVPAYNHAHYLAECIDSVLAQTYSSIELIVLDDGSTDHTRQVLEGYGNRFHWESQNNMGQSATLAKGWTLSKGSILGYLSADDVLRPDAVAEAVAVLETRLEIVTTYCDFDLIDDESRTVRSVAALDFDAKDLVLSMICQPGPGAFFRKEAYLKAGPWDKRLRQNPDLDFWIRMALQGDFARIAKNLAGFRVHEGSQTYQSATVVRADEPILIATRFLERPDLPAWIRANSGRATASACLASAQLHLRAGRLVTSANRLFSAMKASPRTLLSIRAIHVLTSALFGRVLHRLRAIKAQGRV